MTRTAYRIQEAAEAIGVHRTTIHRWIANGELESFTIGDTTFIPAAAIKGPTRPSTDTGDAA